VFSSNVKACLAAVLAAGLLTACQPVKMGAAAIVGDERITTASLDETVQRWDREFKADEMANQMRQGLDDQPQNERQLDIVSESRVRGALNLLVTFRIADEIAKAERIPVGAAQIDQTINALGGQRRVQAGTLADGLPIARMRDYMRFLIIQDGLYQRFGGDANTESPQGQQARQRLTQLFAQTAQRLKVRINPRYGTFDPAQAAIGPVSYCLSRAESGVGQQPGQEGQPGRQQGQPGQVGAGCPAATSAG
jgi:hypothetical protein